MSAPVYEGMPPTDRTYEVAPWGTIRCGGNCKDDYARIEVYSHAEHVWKLQRAALASLRAASAAIGFDIVCTGTWRSCDLQAHLYAGDTHRFAPPSTTAHCRGLAIDVSQALSAGKRTKIRRALLARDWHQARADDEPWHYSFGIKV